MSAAARIDGESPQPLDAERSVLAAMLLEEGAVGRAVRLIDAGAFYLTAHAKLFDGLVALYNARVPVDIITVAEELKKRGDLEAVGGPTFLAQIMGYATTAANLEYHCRIVREQANRRALRRLGVQLQDRAEDGTVSAEELRAFAQAGLDALPLGVAVSPAAAIEFLDLAAICENGFPPVPWIVPGWLAEQDVALVSGDGGIGKSTTVASLAMAVARGQAWCGIQVSGAGRVLVIDEEQSERELARLYLRLGAPHENLRLACQQGVNLTSEQGLARLERVLDQFRPTVTVFDSVQQVFAGVDGNSAADVARVYAQLFRLRRLYSTAPVLIGHLRKPPSDGHISKLHLVHGSVAFGTQASTVWVASSPSRNLLDLVQVKRRDGDRTSLRIRYQSEGPASPIILTGEGPVEEQETVAERAQDFVVTYLAEHGTSPTGWIMKAAAEAKPVLNEKATERALRHLTDIGRIERPKRGYYTLVTPPEAR